MPKPTILLVDDEERALFGLGHILRSGGYRLRFAAGPAEALQVLAAEPVAAVISDQLMPGMSGLELLAVVRERHPGVARLLLTGCGDEALGAAALRSGLLHAFLQKPCDRLEVQATVRAAVLQAAEVEALLRPGHAWDPGPAPGPARRPEDEPRDWPGVGAPARRKG